MREGWSGPPVLTPVDPRMNKRPKTMNILAHASNTPDYTPWLMIEKFTGLWDSEELK